MKFKVGDRVYVNNKCFYKTESSGMNGTITERQDLPRSSRMIPGAKEGYNIVWGSQPLEEARLHGGYVSSYMNDNELEFTTIVFNMQNFRTREAKPNEVELFDNMFVSVMIGNIKVFINK